MSKSKRKKRRAARIRRREVRRNVDLVIYVAQRVAYLLALFALTWLLAYDAVVHHRIDPYILVATGGGYTLRTILRATGRVP